MLAELDAYIAARLKKITFNDKPVTVYDYIPDRDKGNTLFPCMIYLRHEITIREHDKKPDDWLATPSQKTITVAQPGELGGGEVSGPESYTFRPYSTPIDVHYEIGAIATQKDHHDHLLEGIFQAFPPGHTAKIGDHYPLFMHGRPITSDQLDLPIYRTTFLVTVTDIWIERLETEVHPSIGTILPIIEFTP
jgi:hypothetical protein